MIREFLEHGDPSQVALVVAGGGPAITYDQLRRQVEAAAMKLGQLGLGRGDRVAMALPNGLEMLVSFLAAALAGTAAPLNPAYTRNEFQFYLEDIKACALIVPPADADEARSVAGQQRLIITADVDIEGQVRLSAAGGVGSARRFAEPDPEDIALVLHTSGTTGRPKRVPLSHANLLASARNVVQTYRLTPEDISLCVMPLFHVHGLVASALAPLLAGGTVVMVPRFHALSFWSIVRQHRVSWFSAVPTIHQMLLLRAQAGSRPTAERLRFIRSCSAALPPQMMIEMEERFGVPVLEAYGMTEAAHQIASNPLPPGLRKPGSVGLATGVSIAIVNERGQMLPPGARGAVAIKGPNVFGGYEDSPEANAESFVNGWFLTGDEGYLDEDGYLMLLGRTKEMINRGGEKISPYEIDQTLMTHPAVAEAVSFAIPDRIYGEEVAAAVVLKRPATEAELIAHCRSRLADFKCPKAIYIVEAIPRTAATGKVQRRMVAENIRSSKSEIRNTFK